jgi:hypothetical protein
LPFTSTVFQILPGYRLFYAQRTMPFLRSPYSGEVRYLSQPSVSFREVSQTNGSARRTRNLRAVRSMGRSFPAASNLDAHSQAIAWPRKKTELVILPISHRRSDLVAASAGLSGSTMPTRLTWHRQTPLATSPM